MSRTVDRQIGKLVSRVATHRLTAAGATNDRRGTQGANLLNGFIESFNVRRRDECLNTELLFSLADAREKSPPVKGRGHGCPATGT